MHSVRPSCRKSQSGLLDAKLYTSSKYMCSSILLEMWCLLALTQLGWSHAESLPEAEIAPISLAHVDAPCLSWTGTLCATSDCSERGHTECRRPGVFYLFQSCFCQSGFCADGHGRCSSKEQTVLLKGDYSITSASGARLQIVTNWLGESHLALGDEAEVPESGRQWQLALNSDDTLQIHNAYS